MTMTAKQANMILQAFIASEEMDNAARYLQAGRRLARLSDAALNALWVDAWRRLLRRALGGAMDRLHRRGRRTDAAPPAAARAPDPGQVVEARHSAFPRGARGGRTSTSG